MNTIILTIIGVFIVWLLTLFIAYKIGYRQAFREIGTTYQAFKSEFDLMWATLQQKIKELDTSIERNQKMMQDLKKRMGIE